MTLLLIEILMVARSLVSISFGTVIGVDVRQLVWQVLVTLPCFLLFLDFLQYRVEWVDVSDFLLA
jgi:hypothetical protein